MIQLIVSTTGIGKTKQCLNIGANTKIKSLLKIYRYRHFVDSIVDPQNIDFSNLYLGVTTI